MLHGQEGGSIYRNFVWTSFMDDSLTSIYSSIILQNSNLSSYILTFKCKLKQVKIEENFSAYSPYFLPELKIRK